MAVEYRIPNGLISDFVDDALDPSTTPGSEMESLNAWLTTELASEPDTGTQAQKGPITRWFGRAFGDPRMSRSAAQALLPIEPGDPCPILDLLVNPLLASGGVLFDVDDDKPKRNAKIGDVKRKRFWRPKWAKLAVACSGNVLGLPVYFRIPDITANVPAGWPHRRWEDTTDPDNPITVTHTWETWYDGMPGHEPYFSTTQTMYWCSSADTWNRGEPVRAKEWVDAGLSVRSQKAFVDLRDAENPPV